MRDLVRGAALRPGEAGRPGQAASAGRDLRVDFFRGIALWFIFIDHVPGNLLGDFTLRNYALCDATEGFVLLAGYAAGLAYGAAMDRQGLVVAAAQLARRVGTLYVAHIFLFVVFTAQVGYSAAALDSTAYLDELHLDAFGEAPYQALLQALLLGFQPAFLNILPLYVVLLALLVPALPLLRRPAWLMGNSVLLYVAARWGGLGLPSWTGGDWFFNPFAWQLLFALGCGLGYRPPGGRPLALPHHRALAALAGLVLLAGLFTMVVVWHRPELAERLPARLALVLTEVDKTNLHPFRLVSMLALAYLLAHAIPRQAAWLQGRAALPFLLMGQQGLPVFCAGIFLAFLGRLALEVSDRMPMQLAVNAAGLAALVLVGGLAAWYRVRTAAPRRTPPGALPAGQPASTGAE